MNNKVTIIGCGWLGLPLGENLSTDGYYVKGTTTRESKLAQLEEAGINPFLIKWPVIVSVPEELFSSQYIVINIPPGRKDPKMAGMYPDIIKQIIECVQSAETKKIIFVSSTSVYGSQYDLLTEDMVTEPKSTSGKALLGAESKIKASGVDWVILRFGGLAGPERHPGRFLAGRKGLISGDQVINYLHMEDAIGVIKYFITQSLANEVFNVVSPTHPLKREFYPEMAKQIGLAPPQFTSDDNMQKREISVQKLLEHTDYKFIYADPMTYEY